MEQPKELRGNPLISLHESVRQQNDTPRTCGYCLFRDGSNANCSLANKTAHRAFKVATDQFLPRSLDGFEIGPYCNSWTWFGDDE